MTQSKKPEEPLHYNEEPLPDGQRSYSVTQIMVPQSGGNHVRGTAIYIQRLQDVPSLSVRIISDSGASPLMITSLKIDANVGGYMQIAIQAQTLPPDGGPVVGTHYCNIVAIGRPELGK